VFIRRLNFLQAFFLPCRLTIFACIFSCRLTIYAGRFFLQVNKQTNVFLQVNKQTNVFLQVNKQTNVFLQVNKQTNVFLQVHGDKYNSKTTWEVFEIGFFVNIRGH
jgi:hypothetical protein